MHQKSTEGDLLMTRGLYANIHAKRKRIAAGSGETMRKPGAKGAPSAKAFKKAAKTASQPKQNLIIHAGLNHELRRTEGPLRSITEPQ